MRLHHASIMLISLLLLSACTLFPKASCDSVFCQKLVANNNDRVSVWWSPALRDGAGEYSTVSLND